MRGSLILIAGRSGSGKTALMRAAARQLASLEILQTTTTRPRRPDEEPDQEYVFVSDTVYEALQAASDSGDHLDYHGYKYGADTGRGRSQLAAGTNLIGTITPGPRAVELLEAAYRATAITIWLEVSEAVARERIAHDPVRAARLEDDSAKTAFQYTFSPAGVLAQDEAAFAAWTSTIYLVAQTPTVLTRWWTRFLLRGGWSLATTVFQSGRPWPGLSCPDALHCMSDRASLGIMQKLLVVICI